MSFGGIIKARECWFGKFEVEFNCKLYKCSHKNGTAWLTGLGFKYVGCLVSEQKVMGPNSALKLFSESRIYRPIARDDSSYIVI